MSFPMTGCKWWRVDCSECDTTEGIPSCYEPQETCKHGVPMDLDCGGCLVEEEAEQEHVFDDSDETFGEYYKRGEG